MTKTAKKSSPRQPQGRWWVVALVVGAIAVTAVGVTAWRSPSDDTSTKIGSAADPGVAHVHGLGVNPADDSLYVATHTGTFRIPEDGPAQRVGGSYQDTMGFTVAGPDRFLGSGHPDVPALRRGEPGRLGLIESTDGGQSWQPRSLRGEADFHGLAFAHEQVYGLDSTSGQFMVSTDMVNWDDRSTVDLFGFAVDPADADHIVGASPEGLLDSPDGGRQWAPKPSPGLIALSWDAGMGLWGVEPDGTVHRSADGGTTWQPAGRLPGQPEALLAHDGVLFAAALEDDVTGIYRSDDDGRTWQLTYRDKG